MALNNHDSSRAALVELGQAMKKLAVANWIMIGASIVGVILYFIVIMIFTVSQMDYYSYIGFLSINSEFEGMIGLFIFILILIFGALFIGILVLIRFIQYLIKLNQAAKSTSDQNLDKSFKMEIWSILSNIILQIVMTIITFSLLNSILGATDPTAVDPYVVAEELMMRMGLLFFLSLISTTIPAIFKIIAAVAIDNWAEQQLHRGGNDYERQEMKNGTNLMKWGQIISIIPMISFIGPFVYLVGLGKTGKSIQEIYSSSGPGLSGSSIQSTYGTSESWDSSETLSNSMRSSQEQTIRKRKEGFCPFCGTPLPDPNASFCSMCGKKLE